MRMKKIAKNIFNRKMIKMEKMILMKEKMIKINYKLNQRLKRKQQKSSKHS